MSETGAPWVDGLTIGAMLRETARKFPDLDACVFPQFNKRWTWRQFDHEVDRVGRSLMALGLEKGDHAALWATNWPQWVELQFACARVGVVLVNINPAYRSHELAYVLKQSDAKALFLIERFKSSDYFAMLNTAVPELKSSPVGRLLSAEFPKLKEVVSLTENAEPGMRSWSEFLTLGESVSADAFVMRQESLSAGDPINMQYTSGTTGFPKGALLSHRNIVLNAYYVGGCQKITERDRILIQVPFYHCFGCVLGTLCAAVYGAAMIVPYEYFKPDESLKAIASEKATAIYGVPTMYIAILDHPDRPNTPCSSLRTGIMSGSPCPIEVMQRVQRELGIPDLTIAYGQTEASPVVTQTRTDDGTELRVTTVGRPIPGIEIKLVDPATGETLGDNTQGELCVRGHVVMLGYYNMPQQTAAAIDKDGWLHSGDLATRIPSGYFKITGRIKDMVIRGGENIYPREIEEFLYQHPAIQDVAVVGVPDPKYIEELAAWVRLKPGATATEDEIRKFCQKNLAHYKVPKYVRFVTEFPQTVTGKIQKFKIREAMVKELGLEGMAERKMA
jgi:fatty-acyl-CoA synthase